MFLIEIKVTECTFKYKNANEVLISFQSGMGYPETVSSVYYFNHEPIFCFLEQNTFDAMMLVCIIWFVS